MPGQSPLNMMRPERQRAPRQQAVRGRRPWRVIAPVVILVVLAVGWCLLWYWSATVADRTLTGWVEREAAAGRAYSCGTQSIGGFPFRVAARCIDAAAELRSNLPPYSLHAKDITVLAEVYHPTVLVGEISSPLTVAEPGQPTSFVANWSRARVSVRGVPPEPDGLSVRADRARIDRVSGGNTEMLFTTDNTELNARVIGGLASNNPVIDVTLRFTATAVPTLHPLLADPLKGDIEVVLRGFKDLLPKPWAQRFREMQAAGGGIEIKSLRIERTNSIIVGSGKLTLNEQGKADGLIRVGVAGVERLVPLVGLDKLIGHGIDRLSGTAGSSGQGLNVLDRLMPGLSGAIRDTANASVIENLKKMGQPTEIDNKPAIVLPVRISGGVISLGVFPLGEVPPLF